MKTFGGSSAEVSTDLPCFTGVRLTQLEILITKPVWHWTWCVGR